MTALDANMPGKLKLELIGGRMLGVQGHSGIQEVPSLAIIHCLDGCLANTVVGLENLIDLVEFDLCA